VIGWAGGWRVKEDLDMMMQAWSVIAQLHDVHFVLAGPVREEHKAMIPAKRLTYREWVPVSQYPHQYADMDIACCPLADMPFNHKKTPCKAFEAGAAECAVVASPTVYGDVIEHGKNGYIARDLDDWVFYLSTLIQNEKKRKEMARRWSYRVEQRYNIDNNCWLWADAWQKIFLAGPKDHTHDNARDLAGAVLAG
jgi:glycosyltransferase involved in cell wall biosynthesis